jgi:Septum formation
MRCVECRAETAEAAGFCPQCGAPVISQPSGADAAVDGPGDPIAPSAGDGAHQSAGQRLEPSARRNALVLACLGLVVLVAVTALVWSATRIVARLISSTSPRSSVSTSPRSSASPTASARQLTRDQLRPGDCLQVANINTINAWPGVFMAVPCTQPHTGEVFFAGNIWPSSLAYPGDQPVNDQADARCNSVFTTYVGISVDQSAHTYAFDMPDDGSWVIGDRSVQCIAYDPGGASMNVSIKGSKM